MTDVVTDKVTYVSTATQTATVTDKVTMVETMTVVQPTTYVSVYVQTSIMDQVCWTFVLFIFHPDLVTLLDQDHGRNYYCNHDGPCDIPADHNISFYCYCHGDCLVTVSQPGTFFSPSL